MGFFCSSVSLNQTIVGGASVNSVCQQGKIQLFDFGLYRHSGHFLQRVHKLIIATLYIDHQLCLLNNSRDNL